MDRALSSPCRSRRVVLAWVVALVLVGVQPHATRAQQAAVAASDSARRPARPSHYWRRVAAGVAASLLAHEGAHVGTAVAVGGDPMFGLSKGRPTVYSGLDAFEEPEKQFLFSSMGLNVQTLLDEAILDVPHGGYGGVALMHTVRIHRDGRYANFFVRPTPAGEHGLRMGLNVR